MGRSEETWLAESEPSGEPAIRTRLVLIACLALLALVLFAALVIGFTRSTS
jgi:preprotein translocase subunit Sec61beta